MEVNAKSNHRCNCCFESRFDQCKLALNQYEVSKFDVVPLKLLLHGLQD